MARLGWPRGWAGRPGLGWSVGVRWGAAKMAVMPRYALLLAPSANRVYADQAARLSLAELGAFGSVLSTELSDISEMSLGGVSYLGFSGDLGARDIAYLSNMSAAYALFELVGPEDLL